MYTNINKYILCMWITNNSSPQSFSPIKQNRKFYEPCAFSFSRTYLYPQMIFISPIKIYGNTSRRTDFLLKYTIWLVFFGLYHLFRTACIRANWSRTIFSLYQFGNYA